VFDRTKALSLDTWQDGKPVLHAFAEFDKLLGEPSYRASAKSRSAALIIELGLGKSDTGPFVIPRRNRGGLVTRPRTCGIVIIADGRADVLGIIDAESRPTLAKFNRDIVAARTARPSAT
jgi:hypothetical protein